MTIARRACYQNNTVDDCAYRDVAAIYQTGDDRRPVHFAISAFDWSADHAALVERCVHRPVLENFDKLCAVYVINQVGAPYCKIGISDRPETRKIDLQISHWADLAISHILWVWEGRAREVEQLSHLMAKELGCYVRGEWVKAKPEDAALIMVGAASALGATASGPDGVERTFKDLAASSVTATATERRLQAAERDRRNGYG